MMWLIIGNYEIHSSSTKKQLLKEVIMLKKDLEHGTVYIFDEVIKLITKVAITEIEGVETSSSLIKGNFFKTLKGNYRSINVNSESCDSVCVDVTVGIYYGKNIPQVIKELQDAIKNHIEIFTGFHVKEINVLVNEIIIEE